MKKFINNDCSSIVLFKIELRMLDVLEEHVLPDMAFENFREL